MMRRIKVSLCFFSFALLTFATTASAQPFATFPMVRGELVATCFSGLQSGQTQAPYAANPFGAVMGVIDARIPPVDANSPIPVLDTNWSALMYHNELGNAGHFWTSQNLGQVFGITLDDADPPNIYVTATTMYGLFAFGPGGAGGVYRIDGVTGDICVIASLPNTGPALGDVCYDATSRNLFVSNFEDGLVYRVAVDSQDPSNPCAVGDAVVAYDHGLNGRPNGVVPSTNASLTAIPDDPSVDYTPKGRRVWAVQMHEGRLYYSVWVLGNPHEIWSVEVDSAGNINPATAFYEIEMPSRPGGSQSFPVSDIAFSDAGNMFAAQRTMSADFGNLHNGSPGGAHAARVIKFEGSQAAWTPSVEEYKLGSIFSEENGAGGVDVDCDENIWATSDAIHFGNPDTVYGLQWIAAGGNAGDPAVQNSYIIGLNGGFAKSEIGDVEIYREICQCMDIEAETVECDADNPGGLVYTFDVTNDSGVDATRIIFTPQTPGLQFSPHYLNTPVADGETVTASTNISGYTEGEEFCFTITLLSADGYVCCSIDICIDPPRCDCLAFENERIICDPENPGSYLYSVHLTNLTDDVLEHLYIFPDDPSITITPDYFDVPAVNPGGSGNLSFTITGGQPGDEVCFLMTVHDQQLHECCGVERCVILPDCCTGDCNDIAINLQGDFPTELDCGADFVVPGATAFNRCTDKELQVSISGSVDTSHPGEYCVSYVVLNDQGQKCEERYCVTVLDNCCQGGCDDLTWTLLGDFPQELDCNAEFEVPGATAVDCDGNDWQVSVSGTVDTAKPGEHCVTYTAVNAVGEKCEITYCVTVLDNCCDPDTIAPDIILLTPFPSTVNCGAAFPYPEVLVRDNCDPQVGWSIEGEIDTSIPGIQCLTYIATDAAGNTATETHCVMVLDNCNVGVPNDTPAFHTADLNRDSKIGLSELLRVVQFYAVGGYHCDTTTEDGFAPGTGSHDGAKHDCDFDKEDWIIDLIEMLRLIQIFNAGSYHSCGGGAEDGFCPGPA
ncbi:MAG: DUF5011 domain-containing protein [Candidatus Hydrogenedens sp.]|nr:DUF5011 domain-containing protein [Candidatus Hydrogenedens sp.]